MVHALHQRHSSFLTCPGSAAQAIKPWDRNSQNKVANSIAAGWNALHTLSSFAFVRKPEDSLWRHYPWLLALFVAPFLFGSITVEGQAVLGFLLAISALLLANQTSALEPRVCPALLGWTAFGLL